MNNGLVWTFARSGLVHSTGIMHQVAFDKTTTATATTKKRTPISLALHTFAIRIGIAAIKYSLSLKKSFNGLRRARERTLTKHIENQKLHYDGV